MLTPLCRQLFTYDNTTMPANNKYVVTAHQVPSYQQFHDQCLKPNKVCLFKCSLLNDWPCRSRWLNENGSINWQYFRETYGSMSVPVYDCNKTYFNSNHCSQMILKDFVDYMQKASDRSEHVLYLKDWHLFKHVDQAQVYQVPLFFQSDYLNDFCVKHEHDDYRFVYIGPKSSW